MNLLQKYQAVRAASEAICRPLQKEDYVVQPVVDVSPPKWHLGHITWFWEAFILSQHQPGYQPYNPDYNYVFNSYYETIGARVVRTDRGNLSRPSVDEVYSYRKYVDEKMVDLITAGPDEQLERLIILGLNHEQQHQELLYTDIKYILGHNPLFPAWSDHDIDEGPPPSQPGSTGDLLTLAPGDATRGPGASAGCRFLSVPSGLYEIGYQGDGFCFDNELARH